MSSRLICTSRNSESMPVATKIHTHPQEGYWKSQKLDFCKGKCVPRLKFTEGGVRFKPKNPSQELWYEYFLEQKTIWPSSYIMFIVIFNYNLCTLFRYVVSYAQSNYSEPQRLTQAGYSHAVSLNEVKSETRKFDSQN